MKWRSGSGRLNSLDDHLDHGTREQRSSAIIGSLGREKMTAFASPRHATAARVTGRSSTTPPRARGETLLGLPWPAKGRKRSRSGPILASRRRRFPPSSRKSLPRRPLAIPGPPAQAPFPPAPSRQVRRARAPRPGASGPRSRRPEEKAFRFPLMLWVGIDVTRRRIIGSLCHVGLLGAKDLAGPHLHHLSSNPWSAARHNSGNGRSRIEAMIDPHTRDLRCLQRK